MGQCQWCGCENQPTSEHAEPLGIFTAPFGRRRLTLVGTVCDVHKPMLDKARFSYWICGKLAFLHEAEASDEQRE